MSSDEGEPTSPVLPRDSDRGSSVSSELQDEYEELLRYAVVTPKFDTHTGAHLQLQSTHASADGQSFRGNDDAGSLCAAGSAPEAEDGRQSNRSIRSAQGSPAIVEHRTDSRASYVERMAGRSSGRASVVSSAPSERLHRAPERSAQSSPDPVVAVVTEMFISEENMNRMESILDTWSDSLKSNVLMELRKWKLSFIEHHQLEMRKEREKHAAQTAGLSAELDSLKGLLHTYETSNQRKDEVIVNLTQALDRQKEKLEVMRALTHWRLQHSEAKEEAHGARRAEQHYRLQLKKKVFGGWSSLVQRHWKDQVERACRARAEEVCVRLSADYEAKLAEHCQAVEKAHAEVLRTRLERERYEESMKKAFMRGVCALNMEALGMFHTAGGRSEQPAVHEQHDAPPPRDDPGSGSLVQLQPRPASSAARSSPVHFDPPAHSETEDTVGSSVPGSRAEVGHKVVHSSFSPGGAESTQFHSSLPPGGVASVQFHSSLPPGGVSNTHFHSSLPQGGVASTHVHSSFPSGGAANSHKQTVGTAVGLSFQVSGRVVTAGQQKPSKTVTARITARADLGRTARGSIQVMGVAPPMSSVIVERHHPVTQLTVGQATAAKYPRSSQRSHSPAGRSSRAHASTCHIHSIKVVD